MRKHCLPGLVPALVLNILIAATAFAEGPLPLGAATQLRALPAPTTVSPELARLIKAPPLAHWNTHPQNAGEWRELIAHVADTARPFLPGLRERWGVESVPGKLGGVPVFTLTPKRIAPGHEGLVLLHIHGGGYVFHPGETGTGEGILMAGLGGFKVVSVDYRMPPEHPYPAALDDALAAYEWILDRYPGKPICLIGESAGGGLCYALALKLKELKLPLPAGIVALSPWTDLTLSGRSHLENKEADPSLTTEKLAIFARDYCGQEDPASPCVSPLLGDLRGLPESLIFVGGDEILLDDAVRMASALQKAGCAAHLTVAPDMWHAYILYGLEARKEDAEMIRDFLRSKLS